MRYLLILTIALAATIAWQTSVVADDPEGTKSRCASATTSTENRAAPGTDDAECE